MNLPELFRHYLKLQKVKPVTAKNYLVDINNFLEWLATKTGIKHKVAGKAVFGLFTRETIEEYRADLASKKIPISTINRRLSALRKFGQFGLSQGWIRKNEASKVKNLQAGAATDQAPKEEILIGFRKHLEKEKASQLTIKNYLSDLRHFLAWLEVIT